MSDEAVPPGQKSEFESDGDAAAVLDLGDVSLGRTRTEEYFDLGAVVVGGSGPSIEPYDPIRHRESARGKLALILMSLLATLCVGLVILAFALIRPVDRELLALLIAGILGPVTAIVGTVVGFYFGQSSIKSDKDRFR